MGLTEEEKRDHILAAGQRVFSRVGYNAATVKEIITEAGISRRTFYFYFGGKKEILLRLIDRFILNVKQIKDAVSPAALKSAAEVREQCIQAAEELIKLVTGNPELVRVLMEGLCLKDDVLHPRSDKVVRTLRSYIRKYLKVVQAKGLVYRGDAELLATMLIGMYLAVIQRYFLESPPPPDNIVQEILAFQDRALLRK